ncbi:PEP-CTERM sorting domain-containing protein [Aeoliella sp. SH292]|uniref:PEP-CTERM sorting domain-containing protein n=1 Tax=Aeoliella sp. SH292 TaxID=3454464 RepID=UPI003F99854F
MIMNVSGRMKLWIAASVAMLALCPLAPGQIISMNFLEWDGNQTFAGGQDIGPLRTNSSFWNTSGATPAGGTITDAMDFTGAASTVDITWSANNAWYNSVGTGTDEAKLGVGYLDDGGAGISVTLSQIPFANYRVIGLYASDQSNQTPGNAVARDMNVNGTWVFGGATSLSVPSYANINESFGATGKYWSPLTTTTKGNYWTFDVSGTSTVTITQGPGSDGGRAALAGLIIQDLDTIIYDNALRLTVDRDSGNVSLTNNTGADIDLAGVGLLSATGSWDTTAWKSFATTYDQNGTVASDDNWMEIVRSPEELSEVTLTTGSIAQGQTINLGDGLWQQYPSEAATLFEYLVAGADDSVRGIVDFVDSDSSNGFAPFGFADLNFDGTIDGLDWAVQRDNFGTDLASLSVTGSYQRGDLDADGDNDIDDLLMFKDLFIAMNSAEAFAALTNGSQVPEPASVITVCSALVLGLCWRRKSRVVAMLVAGLALMGGSQALAQSSISVNFQGPAVTGPAGQSGSSNWNNLNGAVGSGGLINQAGAATGAGIEWRAATVYQNGPQDTENAKLMYGYLDDNGGAGVDVFVAGVPATSYNLTVYFNWDESGENIFDLNINGTDYQTTGMFQVGTGLYNATNTITVNGLSGPVRMTSGGRTVPGVSNIAGFEITASSFLTPAQTALTLQVDPSNGLAQIVNDTAINETVVLEYYEIRSAGGRLNANSWNPLDTGPKDANFWEVLGTPSSQMLAEFNLTGEQGLNDGNSLFLGAAYQTGVGQTPLEFKYRDALSGQMRTGNVEFTTIESPSTPGDYNGDGVVNLADYTVWRDNLGAAEGSLLAGNGDGSGTVDAGDYSRWKQNFGAGVGGGSGSLQAPSAVPEPGSIALLATLAGTVFVTRKFRKGVKLVSSHQAIRGIALLFVVALIGVPTAKAGVTLDRLYSFGEDDLENPVANQTIGANSNNVTYDSVGPTRAYIDLNVSGAPKYVSVGPTGLNRPGAGSGTFGAQFSGSGDVLWTNLPLNRPDVLAGPTEVGDPLITPTLPLIDPNGSSPYPFNYDNITARGLQMWVYPQAGAKLGSERQVIVMDTETAGGVAITADGKWTQINSGHTNDTDIEATVNVTGNTWYHVMQHIFTAGDSRAPEVDGGQDFAEYMSVVYVNGIAVSASADSQPPEGFVSGGTRVGQLTVGAAEMQGDGLGAVHGEYFQGTVDDLEMYVYGDNSDVTTSPAGQNYGTFQLFQDNDWIASQLNTLLGGSPLVPGDANFDGVVSGDGTGTPANDDVAALVANWRFTNSFQGAHNVVTAGDFGTWQKGDFNLDGVVDFSDWSVLRANHINPSGLNLTALLAGATTVPEPTSIALVLLGVAGFAVRRTLKK